jgi:hypothetical protein
MVRVIVNGVSFYTTKRAIREQRVGDNIAINQAVAALYSNMFNATGISSRVLTYDNKMQQKYYDIQINL